MKKFLFTALFVSMSVGSLWAERIEKTNYKFDFTGKSADGVTAVTKNDVFADSIGYGYDLQPAWDGKSNAPFFFSVNVPDGNYRVTVTLGSKKKAGVTTVRGESRRLFIENETTGRGKTMTKTFIINKRNTKINEKESVRIKPREKSKLNWDNKLTLEFNGDAPCITALDIEKVDNVTTVFLCGNSTVVDQDNEPWASWGQMITRFFDDEVCIANYAESGERSDTFIKAGRLEKILSQAKEGDYIFMEFGHNDEKYHGDGRGAFYYFQYNMKIFLDKALAKGMHPVLLTPTQRRRFEGGKLVNTHGDFPEAIRFIANREQVPLIELNGMTTVLYEALGEEGSKKAFVHYPAGSYPGQTQAFEDNTHFNTYGAYQISKLVLTGIENLRLPLAKHISKDFKGYAPAHPDALDSFHWNDSPFTEIEKPDGN